MMHLVLALLGLLPLPAQDEKIETFIERWGSADLEDRVRATQGVLARWDRWSEADFAKLLKAMEDFDSEVAERAREAIARIRTRREAGAKLVGLVRGVDEAFTTGGDAAKLGVLAEAHQLSLKGQLRDEDLKGLEQLAGKARWTDEQALARFLERTKSQGLLKVPTDRAERALLRAQGVEKLAAEGKAHAVEILPFLKDDEVEVRSTALRMMERLDAREQAPKVVSLLKDSHATIRSEALMLLGGWGRKEFAADFAGLLTDPHGQVRSKAAEALGEWGLKGYAAVIAPLLRDPYGQTRAEAAAALGELGAKDYAADIAALLADHVPAARRNAAFALGKLGAREHADRIVPLLQDADPWVRMSAVQALGMMGQGEYISAIVPLLRHLDDEVRSDTVWVLGRLASKELKREIVWLLEDRDSEVRHDALRVLERLDAREQAASIAKRLKDPSGWVRARAALTLGRLGAQEHAEAVSTLLADEDRRARIWTAVGLGELALRAGDAKLRGDLARRLASAEGDRDRLVGLSASMGLVRLGLKDRAAQREILREFAADGVARPLLGAVMLDALAQANERETYERLGRRVEVTRSVETWKDLADLVKAVGLRLEARDPFPLGRMEAETPTTLRGALEWMLGRYAPPEIVLEGPKVSLMEAPAALDYWQKRLDGK